MIRRAVRYFSIENSHYKESVKCRGWGALGNYLSSQSRFCCCCCCCYFLKGNRKRRESIRYYRNGNEAIIYFHHASSLLNRQRAMLSFTFKERRRNKVSSISQMLLPPLHGIMVPKEALCWKVRAESVHLPGKPGRSSKQWPALPPTAKMMLFSRKFPHTAHLTLHCKVGIQQRREHRCWRQHRLVNKQRRWVPKTCPADATTVMRSAE